MLRRHRFRRSHCFALRSAIEMAKDVELYQLYDEPSNEWFDRRSELCRRAYERTVSKIRAVRATRTATHEVVSDGIYDHYVLTFDCDEHFRGLWEIAQRWSVQMPEGSRVSLQREQAGWCFRVTENFGRDVRAEVDVRSRGFVYLMLTAEAERAWLDNIEIARGIADDVADYLAKGGFTLAPWCRW